MDILITQNGQHEVQPKSVHLPLEGIRIGSAKDCEVQLLSKEIGPKHARLFRDPFGRWILESTQRDVNLWVNGMEGEAFSVHQSDQIQIGPFQLRLVDNQMHSIVPRIAPSADAYVDNDETGQFFTAEASGLPEFSPAKLNNLDQITDSLANLTNVKDLYPEACRHLGRHPGTVALVVKIPKEDVPLADGLSIIAHCSLDEDSSLQTDDSDNTPWNFHLSRTVLAAVRKKRTAFSATTKAEDEDARLSLLGDSAPRMVLAAPIAETPNGLDVLYVDQPHLTPAPGALGYFSVVARMVNLARNTLLMAEINAEKKVLDHQLDTATKIQANLTPKSLNLKDNVEVALHYKPASWVGGDYCELCLALDGRLVFAIGDVAGKGLPAAMVMANLQAMLKSILLFNSDPKQILTKINDMLCDTLLEGMFITLLIGFLDADTGKLEYVNAGHELPLLISRSGTIQSLGKPVNMPLGIMKTEYVAQSYTLSPGECLFMASDGITDTFSPDSNLFGVQRLIETIRASIPQPCRKIIDNIIDATETFRGHLPPSDDVTIMALKWNSHVIRE